MKPWPTDEKEVIEFSEAVGPLLSAIKFAYKLKRQNVDKDIPYSGYDIGQSEQAYSPSPDELFTAEMLEWRLETGQDALDCIVMVIFQLGVEQGKRVLRNSPEYSLLEMNKKISDILDEMKKGKK